MKPMKSIIVWTPYGPCLKLRYKDHEISMSHDGEVSVYPGWNNLGAPCIWTSPVTGTKGIKKARSFIKEWVKEIDNFPF